MHRFGKVFLLLACVTAAIAQTPEPPLSDTRLSVHTLVREDIFAGFLSDNMERFARGEQNLQTLLEKRPDAKYELQAWQAGATLYRAVRAYEAKRTDEFQQTYRKALDLFAQAQKYSANNGNAAGGVAAVTGGSYVLFADRLPQEYRAAAYAQAYDSYQMLWKAQGASIDKLPVHLRGELLAGLAQSAQRTGRAEEANQHLDRILTLMRDTPYEPIAKQWKANPKSAANSTLACMTCHESGRLMARLATLK
jgi:tetratricopeptide (TPR) repeat protein